MNKNFFYTLLAAMLITISAITTYLVMKNNSLTINAIEEEKKFNHKDFQWPQLLELLDSGDIDNILNQEADWVFLTLIYLGDMNELFADKDMNMFIDPLCFSRIYKPEMKAKLESVMWSGLIPKVFADIVDIISKDGVDQKAFRIKYPYVSKVLGEITDQLPSGTLDRLFYVKNIRQIFKDRAFKDARILMTEYKCEENGVTDRIYNNAYLLLNKYSMRSSSQ